MTLPFDPFAEVEQLRRNACRNGLAYLDLAHSAHRVYCLACGNKAGDLQEADRPPWEAVAGKAASIIDLPESEQGALELSAKALAKALYSQYIIEKDGVPNWETESNKTAWEAVGRHLANVIDSDGAASLDFNELEQRISDWALERSTAPQLVLS